MSLAVRQTKKDKTWTAILIEESENSLQRRKAKREQTFRRMYSGVFVLVSAGFVLYCSLFYVGAFFDAGKIIGISQSVRAEKAQKNVRNMPRVKKRTLFSPVIEAFSMNRVYMRKGQTILATYSLPRNSKLSLKIKQCKSMPIVEVFKCEPLGEQGTVIRNRATGFIEFTVSEPGFYYFEDEVIKLPKTELKAFFDYRIVWQRGGKKARKSNPLPQLR